MTTTTETARRSFVTRFAAFGLLLGALTSVGCESDDETCRPDEGCDGIAAIVELETPAPVMAYVADADADADEAGAREHADDDFTSAPRTTHDDDGTRYDAAGDYQMDPETTHGNPGDLSGELEPTHDPSDVAIDDFADAQSPAANEGEAEVEPMMAEAIECPDPDAEGVSYVAQDGEVCATVSVLCLPGWQQIRPECGCGCEFVGDHDPNSFTAE